MKEKNGVSRHIISAVVENRPGVLARIASLFSARGFNIESLNVGETIEDLSVKNADHSQWSRMTITVSGDEQILEQVRKQLEKLIDTLKVTELSREACVERDFALVKLNVPSGKRAEVTNLVHIFKGRIVDVSERRVMVEVTGSEDKLQTFLKLASQYGIVEMVRAGRIALKRGD